VLTLQGAVAHCDMPVESGPTLYLPYSQRFEPGYLAWRLPEFRAYFDEHHVQLPLAKGDAAFFNPAVFHAAGTNRTRDVRRTANLLQVSSAFGRAMETVDREAVVDAVYPVLLERRARGADEEWLERVVAASAEGYPFPTNLDRDPPVDGVAPPSQADVVRRALREEWTPQALRDELRAGAERRAS
jgi:ectoine hydroxylase-related dioxygenase (phytanoyl-CoA dioxygenase family)